MNSLRKRIPLRERHLPDYTLGEEIMNMVTHIVGGALGAVTLVFCILLSSFRGNLAGLLCGIVFGLSMTALYTVSSVYHGLRCPMAKKVFQVLDHCTIYFLIAGTYTPMLLCSMAKLYPLAAWINFAIVWGMAALSMTLNAIDLEKYKVFSMIGYLGMGWVILFTVRQMYDTLGATGFGWLLGGGILYTLGAIFYCIGSKKRYCHSVFHIFVLLGSLSHAICVVGYVL